MDRIKDSQEWFKQSEYDIETGMVMLESGRYIYCVFMCHLAIEKAFKAIYVKKLNKHSPKIHSLVYLAKNTEVDLSEELKEFIESLDEISIPTRYPEELEKSLKEYSKERTAIIYNESKKVLLCLKTELEKL